MANPDLTSSSISILGKYISSLATTTLTSILANSSSSGKVYKINSIYAANVSDSNTVQVDVSINNGSDDRYLVYQIVVPPCTTQILLDKDSYLYLLEGHSVKIKSNLASSIHMTVGYEDIG